MDENIQAAGTFLLPERKNSRKMDVAVTKVFAPYILISFVVPKTLENMLQYYGALGMVQ